MIRRVLIKIILLLILGCCFTVFSASDDDKVKVTGNSIKGDTEKKISYIEGNVRIVQGKSVITTEKARIDMDNKQLFLESKVNYANEDVTIKAEILDYDLKKKTGTFYREVILDRKEQKEKGKVVKDAFKLFADELYFEADSKNFIATKGKTEHKDFNGTAERIEYDDQLEYLSFFGNVYLKRPEGEELRGEKAVIKLKDKSFHVDSKVVIDFDVEDDDEKKTSN
ncbi:MAG TPA: LptA/OstA family protein [Bacillota bacterium]|jgi:lipopolysaccharide export system protein LptA|nr:LptA/OstA family protein [Bacillota bacterium]HOL09413.1 LptA/OstA family protein [Bacillota bacterium]HPO97137.1 LptA/OstA family protein [Bacillota bacterium]